MSFLHIGQKIDKVMGKEQELLDAARSGNVAIIEKLLSSKMKKPTSSGAGFGQILTSFLKSVNTDCIDKKNGYTPLHHAAVNGHRDAVQILLKAEAQPGIVDSQGCTPVHLAAWTGNPEICLQLLTAGTDTTPATPTTITPVHVNQQNGNGDTALHSAAQHGHVAVVDVLLQRNANPTIRNLREESPLDLAAQYGRLEVVKLLLISHPELSRVPWCNQSPLHLASRNGHRDIVDYLLDNGFTVKTKTDAGTALHEAALCGKLDVVRLLLDKGVDVDEENQDGLTVQKLISAHQSEHRSFEHIRQAIQDHLARRQSSITPESETYSSDTSPTPDSALSPARPPPTPAPHTSRSPTATENSLDLYARIHRDKDHPDRVVISTTFSEGDIGPPPLPPRLSCYPDDRSSIVQPTQQQQQQQQQPSGLAPLDQTTYMSMDGASPDSPAGNNKPAPAPAKRTSMAVPKKPPRRKKSPTPVRRAPPLSPSSPTPRSPLASPGASPQLPPKPHRPHDIPAAHSTDQSHSTNTDQSHHSAHTPPPVSPKPKLLPKPLASMGNNSDSSGSGTQQHTTDAGTQAPIPVPTTSAPVSTTLPLHEDKVDNYDILFPKFKDRKSMKVSPEPKRSEFRRANTAPDESIYVEPWSSLLTLPKFQEKQGLLKRTNTSPDEIINSKLFEAASAPNSHSFVPTENVYAEIAAVKGDSLLRDGAQTGVSDLDEEVYCQVPDLSPPVLPADKDDYYKPFPTNGDNLAAKKDHSAAAKGDHSAAAKGDHSASAKEDHSAAKGDNTVSAKKDHSAVTKGDKTEEVKVVEAADREPVKEARTGTTDPGHKAGDKPNYLDFIARKSVPSSQKATPLTPTGYPQPPTPDFPPPSPSTALLGIELKIQEMEPKRKSRDMTTLTDEQDPDSLDSIQEQGQRSEVELHSKGQVTEAKDQQNTLSETSEESALNRDQNSTKGEETSAKEVTDTSSATFQSPVVVVLENSENPPVILYTRDIPIASVDRAVKDVLHSKSKTMNRLCELDEKSELGMSSENGTDDAKNRSGDAENRPDNADVTGSPVLMRRKSSSSSELNLVQFQVEPENDCLLRGSTIGVPPTRKAVSHFYEDVLRNRASVHAPPLEARLIQSPGMEQVDDDIDVDGVMDSINNDLNRLSIGKTDQTSFDETDQWDEVQHILSSFCAPMSRESAFERDLEPAFAKYLAGSGQMESVGEWLEKLGLPQYENLFVGHGFDDVDFLDSRIMEEQDLEEIGVRVHDHRQTILQAALSLPQIVPIDWEKPPAGIEEWLMSLNLLENMETFKSHGYDTMDKVRSILWDLQLRTVLNISLLGHRKRILASLGERHHPEWNGTAKKSVSSLSPEEVKSPFKNVNLYRDYRGIKPTSSSEEDVTSPPPAQTHMGGGDSDDGEVFDRTSRGQSITDKKIHLRPPHQALTQSPVKSWRHRPEMLIKGCCNYTAQYLGSTAVTNLSGTDSTRAGITKLKKSSDAMAKVPVIMLSISFKGVKFIDARSKRVICNHEIGNIFCACQDTDNLNFFAYITRDIETSSHFCHVFSVRSSSLAHDIILTLGESFEVAYQMALKDKAREEAMDLDRQMSLSDRHMSVSDAEVDTHSVVSKTSTNTV